MAGLGNLAALDEVISLVGNKPRFIWLNLVAGFLRGIGGVIGAALAIVLIGYIVSLLGGLPLIGNFIREIQHNIPGGN